MKNFLFISVMLMLLCLSVFASSFINFLDTVINLESYINLGFSVTTPTSIYVKVPAYNDTYEIRESSGATKTYSISYPGLEKTFSPMFFLNFNYRWGPFKASSYLDVTPLFDSTYLMGSVKTSSFLIFDLINQQQSTLSQALSIAFGVEYSQFVIETRKNFVFTKHNNEPFLYAVPPYISAFLLSPAAVLEYKFKGLCMSFSVKPPFMIKRLHTNKGYCYYRPFFFEATQMPEYDFMFKDVVANLSVPDFQFDFSLSYGFDF